MKIIKAYTGYNEKTNTHLYNMFELIEEDELPKIGEILNANSFSTETVTNVRNAYIDYEQDNNDVWNYNYYIITVECTTDWGDGDIDTSIEDRYIAIEKPTINEWYVIRDREAGNEISYFYYLDEAQAELERYEQKDREDGTYTEDFYEIVKAARKDD